MFEQYANIVSQASQVGSWLPVMINLTTSIILIFALMIPLTFFAWMFSWIFFNAKNKLALFFVECSNNFQHKAARYFDNGSKQLKSKFDSEELYYSFEEPDDLTSKKKIDDFEESLEILKNRINSAPNITPDFESSRLKLIKNISNQLESLNAYRDKSVVAKIPRVSEADAQEKIKKQRALFALFVFIPLTVVAVLINTSLLNVFFAEIFRGKEVVGIPYSILIAGTFSIIEAGTGVVLGLMVFNKSSRISANYLMCWLVIFCLIIVEAILYFSIGTSQNIGYMEEVIIFLHENGLWVVFMQGGWMSLIGIAIVISLYLFGHKSAIYYFEYNKYSGFDNFKNTVDDGHSKSKEILENIRQCEKAIEDLIDQINVEDLNAARKKDELPKVINEFLVSFNDDIKKLEKTIRDIKSHKDSLAKDKKNVVKFSSHQSSSHAKSCILDFLLIISAIYLGSIIIPREFVLLSFSEQTSTMIFSSIISLICVISGYIFTQKASVIRTDAGQISKFIAQKRGSFGIFIICILLTCVTIFHWSIFVDNEFIGIRSSLFIMLNVACFYVGTRLSFSLDIWSIYLRCILNHLAGFILLLASITTKIASYVVSVLYELLYALSIPAKTLLKENK